MSFLVVMTGFAAGIWGISIAIALSTNPSIGAAIFCIYIEVLLLVSFFVCLKKYRSTEYKAKQKKNQEDWATYKAAAPERKRQRDELIAQEAERRRRANTVVSTRFIGASSPEYKKSVGDMIVRGAVGGLFGPVGAVVGMATTKEKNVNKQKRRFLVTYEDGHVEEKEASIGEPLYKLYMERLELDK